MRRTLTLLCLLAVATWSAACGSDTNTNAVNSGATRNGVVETNANIPKNMNAGTAPSNVGVLTNDNGNKNTDGITTMNTNGNHNANGNKNANTGMNKNANH